MQGVAEAGVILYNEVLQLYERCVCGTMRRISNLRKEVE